MEVHEVTTHAVVFDEQKQHVLLIQWQNPLGQTVWSFPGGHIKLGETLKDAVKREVREETGYEIQIDALLGVYDNIVTDPHSQKLVAHVITILWITHTISGTLTPSEDEDVITAQWFPLTKTKPLTMSATGRQILNDALVTIKND